MPDKTPRAHRPVLHTVDETAEILKVSDKTVRRLIESRKLAAYRVGSRWRISDDDLRAYLVSCRGI